LTNIILKLDNTCIGNYSQTIGLLISLASAFHKANAHRVGRSTNRTRTDSFSQMRSLTMTSRMKGLIPMLKFDLADEVYAR